MKKKILSLILLGLILTGIYFYVGMGSFLEEKNVNFGVTFSTLMARQLGIDEKELFDAVVSDLKPKKIRIPVYWSDIEKEKGEFDFSAYDYFMKKAEEGGLKIILVVGRKLPRWPECHRPEWSKNLPGEEFEKAVDWQIKTVVERYRRYKAVEAWQVENEPFHKFGSECAQDKIKAEYVDREIELIRSLDSRPILLTDAGKAGSWWTSLARAEILGVTMYYQVWSPRRGVVWSTFGPGFYFIKKGVIQTFFPDKKIIVAELQAEPYGSELLPNYEVSFQEKLMSQDRFRETIKRARRSGFGENYLWGVEWWFWMKETKNNDGIWEEAKKLF